MDSPIRPFRQPRFSVTPAARASGSSPGDENRPDHQVSNSESTTSFARQFTSSPSKYQDRNVLLLLGNKVPSSVPGRRSSIACTKDRKALAPVVVYEDSEPLNESTLSVACERAARQVRSKSLKPLMSVNRSGIVNTRETAKTLRRL